MAIKTLLVHLTLNKDSENRLRIAVNLTKELGGHLLCLYVAAPVHLPAGIEGRGASLSYLAEQKKSALAHKDEMAKMVAQYCKDISHEFIFGEENHLESLMAEVHHSDLTIIGKIDVSHFEDRLIHNFAEDLIMCAGGPVLMLPSSVTEFSFSGLNRLMIAWNYSAQSIRAVRDHMEFIQEAEDVFLMEGGNGKEAINSKPILNYLERHNITRITPLKRLVIDHAGEEILKAADECNANAIIMGAYGHHGFLDRLLGNASRWVLSHSEVPLLLSH